MTRLLNIILYIGVVALLTTIYASCSTTAKIEDGELLYTGVKKLSIDSDYGVKPNEAISEQIATAINVKPNNSLYSPYYRTPFPIGLWVYNHWNDSCTGIKGWLYNKLVEQPVLISDTKPEMRLEMIKTILNDNGYFGSAASYELIKNKKNSKKAKISYNIRLREPYTISTVETNTGDSELGKEIANQVSNQSYLSEGNQYSLDSLNAVRVNITNDLRNKGYYYFSPEYIEYLADSTITGPGKIALKVITTSALTENAAKKYRTGKVTTTINNYFKGQRSKFDTISIHRGTLIKQQKARVSNSLLDRNITFRQGRTFSVRNMDLTQNRLAQTGIFSSVNIDVPPIESISPDQDSLDVNIIATLDQPLEVKLEVQASSKSNSYIGPGLIAGLSQKNLFGGGEQFNIDLTGSYEWQTGRGSSKNGQGFNSYDFGLSTSLAFPRLLAPKFVHRSRRFTHWTTMSLSANLLKRPKYFKMAQFAAAFTWQWHANKNSLNEFTPFKLTYTKLLNTTEQFDSAMVQHPAIAQSFKSQFIPQMSYSYTFDKVINSANSITWSFTATEAGNIFSGIWSLCGSKGEKHMFGTPFSQFVKGQTQLVYRHRVGLSSWLVGRVMTGAAHAFGNSQQVPYSEQFYVGGANSIRAFTVRSIGPGRYHAPITDQHGYYDQTGTFKFEMNLEYRFPIMGYLHGAFFADAGNVWLLADDEQRPYAKIKASRFFKDLALGTGLGLRFDMQMLVVRADLGIGIHAPYDTEKRGYYNIPKFKDSLAFHIAIGYPF